MNESTQDIADIGPYKIIRCIGEGGKGRVYEAEQEKPVRRKVAIKILRSSSSDPGDAIRFNAEQQALALMDHPGIAKVFEAGTETDGRHWFVMELIDGMPLVEFADHHELDTNARLELFVRVCRAVQHAHQKGVIHRDLKPSNILVTMKDGVALPKVIDFGVAKAVGLRLTEETLLTQFGAIIGTPAYMSPEQADGTVFAIDVRVDIYSLGVLLYELLVGCLPVDPRVVGYPGFIAFLKEAEHDAPTPATRFRQLPKEQQDDLARARQLVPAQLMAALNGDLRWVLMSALDKDPSRRYQSAAAFGDDLERIIQGKAISARPPSVTYVLRKFIARNRVVFASAVVVLLALAGGLITATVGMVRAEREAAVANTVSDFLEGVFAEASPFTRSDEEVTARQLLERASQNIETQLAGNPDVQGRLMLRIGAAYRGLGQFDEATPLLERALQLLQEGNAAELLVAEAESELGYHLIFMSEFDRADSLLRSAIATFRREIGHSDDRLSIAVGNLAFNALRSSRNVAGAFEMVDSEIRLISDELGPDHPRLAFLGYMRCWMLRDMGRHVDALAACQESLAFQHRIYDTDRPVIGHNTLAVGHTYRALGQYDLALEYYAKVLAINGRMYGEDHPEIAYTLAAIAESHSRRGELGLALASAEKAVAMMERVHGVFSTEYAATLNVLAGVLTRLGRYAEAETRYQTVIDIDSRSIGPESQRVARRKAAYADMLLRQGRYDEADDQVTGALAILAPDAAPADVGLIGVLQTAGQVSQRLGRMDEAERYLQDAYERASSSPADYPVELAATTRLMACLQGTRESPNDACID